MNARGIGPEEESREGKLSIIIFERWFVPRNESREMKFHGIFPPYWLRLIPPTLRVSRRRWSAMSRENESRTRGQNEDLLGRIKSVVRRVPYRRTPPLRPVALLLYYTCTHTRRARNSIHRQNWIHGGCIAFLPGNPTCGGVWCWCLCGVKYTSRTCTNRVDKEYPLTR
jgi:hypothetical protein